MAVVHGVSSRGAPRRVGATSKEGRRLDQRDDEQRRSAVRDVIRAIPAVGRGRPFASDVTSVYFVDPATGDDTNDGLGPTTSFRTITRAIGELEPGDSLRLHAGSVYGPTTVFSTMAGTPDAPIVVEPYGGPEAVFDGRITDPGFSVVPNAEWEPVSGGHFEEWRTRAVIVHRSRSTSAPSRPFARRAARLPCGPSRAPRVPGPARASGTMMSM
jgi:hypothetical protein